MLIFSMSREELGNKGSECVGLAETCGGYANKLQIYLSLIYTQMHSI